MTDTNVHWAERCDDAQVRVERLIHLATMIGDGEVPTDVLDVIVDDATDVVAAAVGMTVEEFAAAMNEMGGGYRERRESLTEIICSYQLYGWLVEVAHPTWKQLSGDAMSVSWGSYMSRWLYADTYEAALEQALAWAEEEYAQAKATA